MIETLSFIAGKNDKIVKHEKFWGVISD
jgi:hypothetical protein